MKEISFSVDSIGTWFGRRVIPLYKIWTIKKRADTFLGGPVVENPLLSAWHSGSIPDQELRSCTLHGLAKKSKRKSTSLGRLCCFLRVLA